MGNQSFKFHISSILKNYSTKEISEIFDLMPYDDMNRIYCLLIDRIEHGGWPEFMDVKTVEIKREDILKAFTGETVQLLSRAPGKMRTIEKIENGKIYYTEIDAHYDEKGKCELSYEEDAKQVDDAQRYRDIKSK
jgi:hypothetical protein